MRIAWLGLCLFCAIGAADERKPSESEIAALVAQLGHTSYRLREAASRKLLEIGPPAIPVLRKAQAAGDLELRTRALKLISEIERIHAGAGHWRARLPAGRPKRLLAGGGDASTEQAVGRALDWLARHQSRDGRWGGDRFQRKCRQNTCGGVAKLGWWVDTGQSGLATLAFLGAGQTHRSGRYRDTVKIALHYLIKLQTPDGLVGDRRGHYLYNHAIATLVLAEAYGMTGSPQLKEPAEKAARWLVGAQNPGKAWRYHPRDGDNDSSVSIWCVLALRSARAAGLQVKGADVALKSALAFFDSITDDKFYITGYRKRPPRGWQGPTSVRFIAEDLGINTVNTHAATHAPTAIAATARAFLGVPRDDPRRRGMRVVLGSILPRWDPGKQGRLNQIDCYYWHFGTLALFQQGGEEWKTWNAALKTALLPSQRTKRDELGSWDPIGAWGWAGGRVYTTALNALTLEVYYRYPRLGK